MTPQKLPGHLTDNDRTNIGKSYELEVHGGKKGTAIPFNQRSFKRNGVYQMSEMSVEAFNALFKQVKAMPPEEQESWIAANGGELEVAGSLEEEVVAEEEQADE
jgi:hypothetical protein